MTLAPILISVYTRLYLLEQCIASLKQNALCRDSDLYIVSDAAGSEQDREKVEAVRMFVSKLDGFRNVTAINRSVNLGPFLSINQAIDAVLEEHGKVIFLEDDNWVAPNFLQFVNDGLNFYQGDQSIFSISGYNFPVRIPATYPQDVFKWHGFTAWGVGLWRDRWQTIDWDADALRATLLNKRKVQRINRVAEHVVPIARASLQRKRLITDAIISVNLIETNRFSIFPVISKVRNLGHDGSGEHAGRTDRYKKQEIDTGKPYQFVRDLQPDEEINEILRRHFRIPVKAKAMSTLSRIIPKPQREWLKKYLYPERRRRYE